MLSEAARASESRVGRGEPGPDMRSTKLADAIVRRTPGAARQAEENERSGEVHGVRAGRGSTGPVARSLTRLIS